jgi:hypothetical protein
MSKYIFNDRMQNVVNRLAGYLKPGGTILFRDYGPFLVFAWIVSIQIFDQPQS